MKRRLFARCRSGLAALLFLPTDMVRAQGTGGWQARAWDVDVSVPPGSYHATKPIELTGNFKIRIPAGTMLEGVSFFGVKDGSQHWTVESSQMRKVRFGERLGSDFRATDSVFEDCEMDKDTGTYFAWWSTRWQFDNCVFTRKFMRPEIGVTDYGVKASRCTFYNLKLPLVGVKENAAEYMGKDMSFQNCRFVQCDVPETFLAATGDCVFEGCQFQTKRFAWPKETLPFKVRAFFTGTGSAPASFINGPLTVQFGLAPKEAVVGANLPHTQSGGRVTVASFHFPAQFFPLGSEQKSASEIPNIAAPDKLSARPAPVAVGPATAPPAGPAAGVAVGGEVRSFDDLLRTMPAGINVLNSGQLNVAGVDAANEWLKTCVARPVALRTILEVVQATKEESYVNQVLSRDQNVTLRGTTLPAHVVALFRPDATAPLARALRGADFSVHGVVRKAEFVGRGRTVELVLTIGEARTP